MSPNATSLTVLGAGVSPFVRKVRIFLAEKGLAYQHDPVNPMAAPPEFTEVSPLRRIPALRHGDRTLADSSVICAYLERIHPEPALYPEESYAYARALWFEEYADGGLVPVAGGSVFRPLVLMPLLTGAEPDAETEAAARKVVDEKLPPFFDYLERELGDREFFVADRLTIADIGVTSPFVNLRHAGVAPDAERWPRLSAFLERMYGRPSVAALLEEETPVFGKRAARLAG